MRKIKFRAWDKNDGEMIGWLMLREYTAKWLDNNIVIPMQYTGLHDKNGKEIYENDIIKIEGWSEPIQQVIFNRGGFCTIRLGEESASFAHDIKYAEGSVVIGNIYENPELIN